MTVLSIASSTNAQNHQEHKVMTRFTHQVFLEDQWYRRNF